MTKSKIFVTVGSGKAGKHLIPYLLEKGYSVVNADLVPLLIDGVDNINLDVTDSGQIFNALSGYANIPEIKSGESAQNAAHSGVCVASGFPINGLTLLFFFGLDAQMACVFVRCSFPNESVIADA